MKKILILLILFGLDAHSDVGKYPSSGESSTLVAKSSPTVTEAFRNNLSDIQVSGIGSVVKVLSDDLQGSKHQKFILKLDSGITILIAHNIDLAPRISSLTEGDTVKFYGEYEWNSKGGVIHWTHHDPEGRHLSGWLMHNGKKYQ